MLKDEMVSIKLKKPYQIIFDGLPQAGQELERLEPLESAMVKGQIKDFAAKIPVWSILTTRLNFPIFD